MVYGVLGGFLCQGSSVRIKDLFLKEGLRTFT